MYSQRIVQTSQYKKSINNQKMKLDIIKYVSLIQIFLLFIIAILFINTGDKIEKIEEKMKSQIPDKTKISSDENELLKKIEEKWKEKI